MKSTRTRIMMLAALISSALALSAYASPSTPVSINTTGSIDYSPRAFTYTLFVNSTGYYAKNINGTVVFSNQDATNIVRNVFGSSWKGGNVLFQSGLYVLSPVILYINNTVIDGQGDNSILQIAPGISGQSHPRLIEVLASHNVTIEDIHLDGNLPYNNVTDNVVMGLDIVDSWNVTIQNCYVTNWRVFGIYVAASSSGSDVHDIEIR